MEQTSNLNDLNNGPSDLGGGSLRIMPPGNDSIKQLAALAELHHKMHSGFILIGILETNNVRMPWEKTHDINLSSHILNIHNSPQLLLRDGFASKSLTRNPISAKIRDAELATAKLMAELIAGGDVIAGSVLENGELRGGFMRRGAVVFDGEGVRFLTLLVLSFPAIAGSGGAAIAHCGGCFLEEEMERREYGNASLRSQSLEVKE